MTGTGQTLAQVLAEHRLFGSLDDGDTPECGCGATPPEGWWEEDYGELVWHEAHLVAVLLALVPEPRSADPTDAELDLEMSHTAWEHSCRNGHGWWHSRRCCRRQAGHGGQCATGFGAARVRWDSEVAT